MERSHPAADSAFFAAGHWGCLLFLAVLAIVIVGSAVRLLRQGEVTSYEGTLGAVEVLQRSPRQASYRVTLERDDGEPLSLRLLNQGRVLAYLRSAPATQRAQLEVRDGVVRSLTVLERVETIAEREAPPLLLAATTSLSLVLLAALAWPMLRARPVLPGRPPALRGEEEE